MGQFENLMCVHLSSSIETFIIQVMRISNIQIIIGQQMFLIFTFTDLVNFDLSDIRNDRKSRWRQI